LDPYYAVEGRKEKGEALGPARFPQRRNKRTKKNKIEEESTEIGKICAQLGPFRFIFIRNRLRPIYPAMQAQCSVSVTMLGCMEISKAIGRRKGLSSE
jgi:hypothetical protein